MLTVTLPPSAFDRRLRMLPTLAPSLSRPAGRSAKRRSGYDAEPQRFGRITNSGVRGCRRYASLVDETGQSRSNGASALRPWLRRVLKVGFGLVQVLLVIRIVVLLFAPSPTD